MEWSRPSPITHMIRTSTLLSNSLGLTIKIFSGRLPPYLGVERKFLLSTYFLLLTWGRCKGAWMRIGENCYLTTEILA